MASSGLADFALLPFRDAGRGLDRCLDRGGAALPALLAAFLGLLAGWWVYVPAHELLHAAACAAAGGEVRRLEISPLYGGGLLARALPFVVSGGEYAGRLSGFETGGSDLVYLATDLGPFVLALFPGVWGLRRAAAARRPLAFGLALPFALAPLLSLTGDAYEIGSLVVTRLPPWSAPEVRALLRGDDLFARISDLAATARAPWGGAALAGLAGVLWAWAVYGLGSFAARALGQPPVDDHIGRVGRVGLPGPDLTRPAGPSPSPGRPGRWRGRRPSPRRSGP